MNIQEIKKQDFINYINTYWLDTPLSIYKCTHEYNSLGTGIGIYDNELLIGFIFYIPFAGIPLWFRHLQQNEPESFKYYDKIWINKLVEIHPDYRFKGLGSMLLTEVYKLMENFNIMNDCILLTLSEYTRNHINFYTKNGFTHLKDIQSSKYYYFYKK